MHEGIFIWDGLAPSPFALGGGVATVGVRCASLLKRAGQAEPHILNGKTIEMLLASKKDPGHGNACLPEEPAVDETVKTRIRSDCEMRGSTQGSA
ncbi:hypothetical protein G3N56_17570 [Desulfovibrio sulfodismutans]|uniref:Uncharacterized protein n=1 Tax=Desulfolutivibrio sulfodismutans TaxID=63561 RepID=A0A7K3NQQ9_9BACT|nr:hypothetical protein [Desulfolutivibrio sulfodismutans]NDY58546.1 hypothetical protein [Desulfolutivibrio sulfodismutans]QLA13911.1 hypothetical protein GD606_17400 [Desulfolutivibrio sulfodismutans DSM 3696]